MRVGAILASAGSPTWFDATPTASVVVATYNRVGFLPGLLEALAEQTIPVEVVIADDGSTDGTWAWLEAFVAHTALPMLALRIEPTGGPSVPRNTAAAHAHTEILAMT